MTCLAVLKKRNGKLIFASDKRVSWGMMKAQVLTGSKTVKRNGIIIAGTGTCYLITLAEQILKFRKPNKNEDPTQFIHNVFLEELKKLLIKKGFQRNGELHITDSFRTVLLIGCKSRLFELDIDSDGDKLSMIAVDEIDTPYAHGCGGYYALGSLLTTEGSGLSEKERLKKALEVAAHMSPGCDTNIDFIEESE